MDLDYHDDFEDEKPEEALLPSPRRARIPRFTIVAIIIVSVSVIAIADIFSYYTSGSSYISGQMFRPTVKVEPLPCKDPVVRREWRTLDDTEKQSYLKSVQCLWEHPSRLGLNHSLYEDFPWVHSRVGNFSHNTPAFIAWHRYFLNIYEQTLQEQCGYTGHLVYWDWTLDSEDMTKSPIWNSHDGFGGNGNVNSDRSVGYGHCVTDGPFANRTLHYFGAEFIDHCFSRGFAHERQLKVVWNPKVNARAVERVLSMPDYESFNIALEDGPHNAIPKSIRGDIFRVTSPNDRVWWMWQQRNPRQRLFQYGHNGDTLDDVFRFEGFAPDRKVSEVISTETEVLCYRY